MFPSLITQIGIDYNLIIVDFHSTDGFSDQLLTQVNNFREILSPNLKSIQYMRYEQDIKFNPREAKNLGVRHDADVDYLAFSDADVFLGIDYLKHHIDKIKSGKSFVATRIQETKAGDSRRIDPIVNYGNVIVSRQDFLNVGGWDESVKSYGGDDDDLFHRLKLIGLREINPIDIVDARQYSILHDDRLRLNEFENPVRCNVVNVQNEIYNNTNPFNVNNKFLYFQNGIILLW